MNKTILCIIIYSVVSYYAVFPQQKGVIAVSASVNANQSALTLDGNSSTSWMLTAENVKDDHFLMFSLQTPSDVKGLVIESVGITNRELRDLIDIFVTYDPMNFGDAVKYTVGGENNMFTINFLPKYGAYVKISFKGGIVNKSISINEIDIVYDEKKRVQREMKEQPWRDPQLPVDKRVELLLNAMTPEDKMELLREGWGIPGIPHLGIPFLNKVEAIHGYSYGSGATIFPQSIAMGATWNKELVEKVAMIIGDETVSAHTLQAWSPVLDVAQDARWGRCEETYGEDPVLVSQIGGAWIKGYQSKGLLTTPKHFGMHGAPLGGRDSHDIGLSEREAREIHLVPFRHVVKNYDCQSIMIAYSDYLGVPIAKSEELLHGILREEWGFNGYIVSDCGALGNLTSRKHYTAKDFVEAANQALAAGIATNCGDTYNNKDVIEAAKKGELNMENLDNVCRSLLRVIFRNGLFEHNPSKPLDWDQTYPGWNSPEHRDVAREAARQAVVLLENKNNILPLSKSINTIAVIGPGADDLQPGDYTQQLQPGQLKSVLTGIKAAVGPNTKVLYEKGCEFFSQERYEIDKVLAVTGKSDVVVMVLGDCSNSENMQGMVKTSGENHDLATLVLQGYQQKMLEEVCKTGKPVILVLQAGRPYNLSYAAEHCEAILVNWLPGQEGGYATADVLFGDYNPAGRLPMTFPRHVGQLPLYYNFKTSGRRYEYSDMEFYPLYPFGYGLSYTQFSYADLKTEVLSDGSVIVKVKVSNTGERKGDEVVQLYITDMYATVKTRVMELKDFERITLASRETKEVIFKLSPYDLSLLNDKMDRVVEPGEFKIMVGGKSPSYKAADRIKDSVGFQHTSEGLNGIIEYPLSYSADFDIEYTGMEENLVNHNKNVFVTVKNKGNLTDTGKIYLYMNDNRSDEVHHFELDPGQETKINFEIDKNTEIQNLTFVTKYKKLTIDY
ncbi:glycoside hydrolase family 3 C-terminal domain-containing protein [Seramator thermalis]|uniref:glycoside hydrolase family 3 C-terminal domain-containing protein n=1 Tax=Seramator thermalis TaxID=2496270 RepID=UPI00101C2F8D|nr:glycoside hydrolase family 3 N-terminal domain-containing protein [Seramator thermalis]